MKRTMVIGAACGVFLAGCGGGSTDAGAAGGEAVGGLPACADVWVAGQVLPQKYEGCMMGADVMAAAVTYKCDGGSFTAYNDKFYARFGGAIIAVHGEMSADPADGNFYSKCLA
jgi:hypothetical protein